MTANRGTQRRCTRSATTAAAFPLLLVLMGCDVPNLPLPGRSTSTSASVQPVGVPCAGKLDEIEKIERLLAIVAAQHEAKFIRNGTAYSATEASEHLRRKLDNAGSRVSSALDFIEKVGSRSSVSGKDYLIEFPDGHRVSTGEFLRNELAKLEQCTEPAAAKPVAVEPVATEQIATEPVTTEPE